MRPDQELIQQWVEPNSRVLDLGCGDGSLLSYLAEQKAVKGIGLEIDADNIQHCLTQGVNVIEQDIDAGLDNFETASFDTVLLAQTIQALSRPDFLLDEMLRIGRRGIVTFPNFGNWKTRLFLSCLGRMPVSDFMPHEWYNTPNIHFCTVKDFDALCARKGIRVLARTVVDAQHQGSWAMKAWPNFLGEVAIYHLSMSEG